MKLIQIDLSNYVIIDETINSFKEGDFVLINCSEIEVKNEVKEVIECENHVIGLSGEIPVFENNRLTNKINTIHLDYCKKIIYSTTPLNGVIYIDIDNIRSLLDYTKQKITLSGQDLVNIITEFKEKKISIFSFVSDVINSKTPDKDEWDVYLDDNHIHLKENKDFLIKREQYIKILGLLENICDWSSLKEHPIGKKAKEALNILTYEEL